MKTIRWQPVGMALAAITFSMASLTAHAQWSETAALTASDGQSGDSFGSVFAVDGNTLVVGAPGRNQFAGAAYVFSEINGVWTQIAELTPSNSTGGLLFGQSVAISGNTIVVGADAAATFSADGTGYVFVKPVTGWTNMTETAQLSPSDRTSFNSFGEAVAISNNTIIVGAEQQPVGSNQEQGAAYIFVKPATGWTSMTQTAELTASDGAANDHLGVAVAIQGSTAVVGAILYNTPQGQGAAYVFQKPATGWANEQDTAKLTATDPTFLALLGNSLAISADEATIVAGAPRRWPGFGPIGAAYIYSKPASGWQSGTENSELLAPGPALFFGSVAINGPGTVIAVGAPVTSSNTGINQGSAYVYHKPSSGWRTLPQANARLNPPTLQQNGYFGRSVAVRANSVIVGESGAAVNSNSNQGAAFVFSRK